MRRSKVFLISLVCMCGLVGPASAVTWTAGEIVRAMQQALANGQPFDRLMAEKVRDELALKGFQIVDGQLVYSAPVPDARVSLAQAADDAIRSILHNGGDGLIDNRQQLVNDYMGMLASLDPTPGACTLPIPAGSPTALRSTNANITARFSNSGTYLDLRTNPNQVLLKLGVDADVNAQARVGLEWCGVVAWPYSCSQWVRNPGCPPPYYACDVCWRKPCGICPPRPEPCNCGTRYPACPLPDICAVPIPDPRIQQESWTDWAPAVLTGPIRGSLTLTLNHSLTVSNNTITIGANAVLSGTATSLPSLATLGLVVPDLRLIDVPSPPSPTPQVPHVVTSAGLQTLGAQASHLLLLMKLNGYNEKLVIEAVMPGLIAQQQQRLDTLFNSYFPITLELPTVGDFNNLDPASQALLKLMLDYLYEHLDVVGEFALDVVRNNWTEVLYYVLTDNRAALAQLFAYQAMCPSIERLKANMPVTPLYTTAGGTCAAVDPRNPGAGPFFATANCQTAIGFQAENFSGFCRESLTAKPNPLLGNAAAWPTTNIETDTLSTLPDPSSKWTLSSAAQLAVGVEPIGANHVPFMKRVRYRQAGSCELEMRVYKKNIADTNLTPLLWIHGGAWTYRSSGFLGMESLVSNYTQQNFVVFAPFYRLAGDKDGNRECRNATWQDMVADVEAALDWVRLNGVAYGASDTTRVPVTGQSAGAHLAGWLMTHRPTEISRGLLVYPPTDLNDFLVRLQGVGGATFPPLSDSAATPYDPSSAQEIVETYLQLPTGAARTVNLNNPPLFVSENSFAQRIGSAPLTYPPAFILHGTRDSLLTYTQSEVLCEGYGGNVNVDWSATTDLRAIHTCGDRSRLHLFKEADHAFEVCPYANIPSACRAGSSASASLLVDSLQQGRRWLLDPPSVPVNIRVPLASLSGDFRITWGAATGTVTRYELYESTDRSFATPGTLVYSGPALSASLSRRVRGSYTYYYRVRACNNSLCSDYRQGSNGVYVFRLF